MVSALRWHPPSRKIEGQDCLNGPVSCQCVFFEQSVSIVYIGYLVAFVLVLTIDNCKLGNNATGGSVMNTVGIIMNLVLHHEE